MLDGSSFISTALAFVGIAPAHETIRQVTPYLPMPVEPLGPCHSVASPPHRVPPALDKLAAPIGSLNEAAKSTKKSLPIQDAISLYLSEIDGYVGEAVFEIAWLTKDYARFRIGRPDLALPNVTAAHMSRCLKALGHERLRRDGRHRRGDGRRVVLFYIKAPRNTLRAVA